MREAMAENDDLRDNLYDVADDVGDMAQTIIAAVAMDTGTFRDSVEVKRTKYRRLGKTTQIAKVVSTDDPAKVGAVVWGRKYDNASGFMEAQDIWNRTAAAFNSPAED